MINDLRLQNFRSYKDDSFEFEKGVNIIVGPNGAGKTNLLEALRMICLGGSYRARDTELIMSDEPWSRLDAHSDSGLRSVKLERPFPNEPVAKSFIIGAKTTRRLPHDKTLPVVLFEPDHLQLLTGPKDLRRDFMDDLLQQLSADFALTRRQYKRALTQRNVLLKQGPSMNSQMFAWNVRLGELGGKIAQGRIQLTTKLNAELEKTYRKLSHDKLAIRITYESTCSAEDYGSHLLKRLESSAELDYRRGFTAYGPHRDDFLIRLNDKPAVEVASRGEIRTLLLGLKLLELKLIEDIRSPKPILLLDDVFSELDGARRRALTDFLKGYQTFITTTDADIVVQHFMDKANIIPISTAQDTI